MSLRGTLTFYGGVILDQEYYYPESLAAKTVVGNFWIPRDIVIMAAIFVFNILLFITLNFYFGFLALLIYAFLSMRISRGYSIAKLALLYIRFFITDQLVFFWRLNNE